MEVMPLFILKNLTKIKKWSETAQQNLATLCSYRYAFLQGMQIWSLYPFWTLAKIMLCIFCVSFITNLLPEWPIPSFIMVICIMCSILKQICNDGALGIWACSLFLSLFFTIMQKSQEVMIHRGWEQHFKTGFQKKEYLGKRQSDT